MSLGQSKVYGKECGEHSPWSSRRGSSTLCSCQAQRVHLGFASKAEIAAKQLESVPRAHLKAEKSIEVWRH